MPDLNKLIKMIILELNLNTKILSNSSIDGVLKIALNSL